MAHIVVAVAKIIVTAAGFVGSVVTAGTVGGIAAVVVGAAVITSPYWMKALIPDMSMPQADTDSSRQQTVRGTIEPQKVVYGQAVVSGPIFFVGVAGTDNRDLYHGIALAGHEVEAITNIYFDDEIILNAAISSNAVTSGTYGPVDGETICFVEKKLGTATQASSSLLTSTFTPWTSAHQGKGISYIVTKYVLTDGSQELWDRLTPRNIKALVKGKNDIYDPRLDVAAGNAAGANPTSATYQAWSDNPALCVANYLTDTHIGLGVATSKIDWASIVTAANACDVSVVVPNSSTQKRFTANGVIFATDSYRASLDKLLSSMNGSVLYSNGVYTVKAGIYEAPTESLDEDDLTGTITVKTSVERGERFNTIRPIIIDPAQKHKSSEVPKVQLTSAVSRDNNEVLTRDIQLPFTNSSYMAQRIAHKQIQLGDQQKVLNFPANLSALNIDVGDRVSVTVDELNYSAKVFRCVGWTFSDTQEGAVNLTLIEDDSGSYADPAANEYSTTTANGTITAGFRGVPDPQNLSATAGLKSIELNWTNPVNTSKFKEIVIYASPNSAWANKVEIGRTMGTQFFHDASNGADPLAVGDQRYYWVRAVAYGTGTGSFVESDRNPDNDTSNIQATVGPNNPDYSDIVDDTPAQTAPTSLALVETTVLGNDGSVLPAVRVSWTAPTANTYISFYEVEFKQPSKNEIDLGLVSDNYTATQDYGSVADATTLELNYGSVSEAVIGGGGPFSSVNVYGNNTVISGMKELEEFTFRVRAVTLTGKTSGFITNTITLQGDQTAPAIPGSIVATGGIQQIKLDYDLPSDGDLAYVEIFENTVDNRPGSTLIVKTKSDQHTVTGLGNNVTRYYWLRSVDRSGNVSGYSATFSATTQKVVLDDLAQSVLDEFATGDAFGIEPVTTLVGVTGSHVGQIKFLITTSTLYVWTGTGWTEDLFTASSVSAGSVTAASFASGVEPIEAVTTLPSPINYVGVSILFNTTDKKLYRYDSSVPEFTALVKTTDISGTLGDNLFSDDLRPVERVSALPTTNLSTGRVVMLTTDNKLYRYTGTEWTAAIAAADLSDEVDLATQVFGQVQAANINAKQITTASIASSAIIAEKIDAGAISADKLAANSVTAAAIKANTITALEIKADTITSNQIDTAEIFADSAVIGAIQSSAITTAAITATVANVEFIQSDNIASNQITAGKLAASNVITNTAQISDGIITNAKIGSVIQSSNYSAGSSGWIINKNGSAEFNGVVVSRDLIVATGSQTLSDRSGLFNNNITTLETIYIEGVYPAGFTAWGGASSTLLCNVEITGSWSTNVGSEGTAMIGPVATVMPLTKFSGTQGFTLKIEIVGRKVAGWGSPSNFGIAWKLYKVT